MAFNLARFTGELRVCFLPPRHVRDRKPMAALLERLAWEVNYTGLPIPDDAETSMGWVVIPVGFETDGATVPRLFWWFIPAWGHPIIRAAILHDWLIKCLRSGKPHLAYPTRAAIDRAFYEAARAVGTSFITANLAWLLIRGLSLIKGNG